MSGVNKDNKEFKFIKEQVLPKRRKKFKKWFLPFFMTIIMAIIFGLVAALTFCLAEPRLYNLLHKDGENPFVIPSPTSNGSGNKDDNSKENPDKNPDDNSDDNLKDNPLPTVTPVSEKPNGQDGVTVEPNPVVTQSIDADIEDYLAMHNDIKALYIETAKSILTVSSIIDGKDWFGNPLEKRIYTSGLIVSNNDENIMLLVSLDRVKDASSIKVEINSTTFVDATIHDYESELNLAIISIKNSDIPIRLLEKLVVASMGDSYALTIGSPVLALGNPNGHPESIDIGIITSKGSVVSITDYELDLFNTNIVFNSESDGIIVNLKGEVIGLITRTLQRDLNKELSTVIGISEVKSYINRMVDKIPRIFSGIIAENVPQTDTSGNTITRGVYVYEVRRDSPAFNAGLRSGDIILNVGNRVISNMNNYYSAISSYEPGSEVSFIIKRTSGATDKDMEIKVTLEAKKP